MQPNLHGRMSENKRFCSPAYLTERHDLEDFQSGEEALDSWLRDRALDNMRQEQAEPMSFVHRGRLRL